MTILLFLQQSQKRQAMAQEVKEFSELVEKTNIHFDAAAGKVLKDYFDLEVEKAKEMRHTEKIFSLRAAGTGCCNVLIRSACSVISPKRTESETMRKHQSDLVHCPPRVRTRVLRI